MGVSTRPFPPGAYPVVVVGSGPGGLQLSNALTEVGVDHAVISQDPSPGGMFRRWPYFQRLLSWTKPHAPVERGTRAYERYDWNSLLTEDPAAVAPRGAEAGHLALEHDDGERWVRAQQLVRGPEARVAGPDDAHVGLPVAVQGGAGGREPAEVGPPPRRRVGHLANPDMSLTRAGLE